MTEQMNQLQCKMQEVLNSGTSSTKNEQFDKDGYFVIRNLFKVKPSRIK